MRVSCHNLDRVDVTFDDEHLVANAGLMLPATLAQHLGLRELFDEYVELGDAAGRANVGHKAMTLVHSALAGGDCIDDADFNRVRAAGAAGSLTLRADSGFYNHNVVDACRAADVRYSITAKLYPGLKKVIEAIDESAWTPIAYFLNGADVAETTYHPFGKKGQPCRLIVRRVRPTPGSQLALFTEFSYHAFITDRPGATLELEADHRRHAEIENVIRDLKYGVGLNHFPSGRFGANAAWLGLGVIAHNLARFASRLGLDGAAITTETFRRRYLSLPGRLTYSARRFTLHLPARWPWAQQFLAALTSHRNVLLMT